jgi:diguanylate cyclase (GGDEF)-like protein
MSLKHKVSLIFSILVSLILILNNALYYFSARDLLRKDQEKQMELMAKEISIAIEHSQYGSKYVEDLIGEELRIASLVVKYALNPNVQNVSNDELVKLSKEIGISHITLFQKRDHDIVGVRSSDPHELNLSTKEWGYWFEAFKQLFAQKKVTIPEGQKLPNYWSGPIELSSSDPRHVDKWGYFYDGSTDYMINPYVQDEHIIKFEQLTGPQDILEKTLKNNDTLLEITGFNPNAFGKDPIITKVNGKEIIELRNRPIVFGDYTYQDKDHDIAAVKQAMETGKLVSFDTVVKGKHVIKTFIPINNKNPYIIGFVTDYKVIQDVLNKQLLNNTIISIILLIIVFFVSYIFSGYIVRPIQRILEKVNEIAAGNFGVHVHINRKDEFGRLADRVNVMSDNLKTYTQELKDKHELIQYQAYHDSLTGIGNRRLFMERFNQAIEHEQTITVMFLDLDRFKNINDTLGHAFGDHLLQGVAQRLTECVSEKDTVARIGGDEFALIVPKKQLGEASEIAEKILNKFKDPFVINGHELHVSPSIGISIYPIHGTDSETLIKHADYAMYHAKENGNNSYQFFTTDMDAQSRERLMLENELRKALKKNEFEIYYQPKFDTISEQMTGVEALVRWHHSELGTISPAKFIPIAEETGMILSLGEWILRTACKQNKEWQNTGLPSLRISVNLSAKQFQQANLVEMITDILEETGLEARWLELEITESTIMNNVEDVISKLHELKTMGVHVSIDDFGTGYSSLSYLKELPIDTLKIDQSFVRDLPDHQNNKSIVTAIISMAHSLNLHVIAEGVETEEQLIFLREKGCHEVQGYLFGKPVPAEDFEKNLRKEK